MSSRSTVGYPVPMPVQLSLHEGADRGDYRLFVDPMANSGARPEDFAYASADIDVDADNASSAAVTLTYRAGNLSPLGTDLLRRTDLVLCSYVYQPRDLSEMLTFDQRITQRYTSYFKDFGIYYI